MKKVIFAIAILVASISVANAQRPTYGGNQPQKQLVINVDSTTLGGVIVNVINVQGFQITGNSVKVQSVATYKGVATPNGSVIKVVSFNLPDTTTLKYSNTTALRLLPLATANVYGLHISN